MVPTTQIGPPLWPEAATSAAVAFWARATSRSFAARLCGSKSMPCRKARKRSTRPRSTTSHGRSSRLSRAAAAAVSFHVAARLAERSERAGLLGRPMASCSINTIRTAGTGATCTGATRSATIWCTGASCRSPSTRTATATGAFPAAPWSIAKTRPASRTGTATCWCWPTPAPAAASASPTATTPAAPGTNSTAIPWFGTRGAIPRLLWHAPTKRWVMAVYDEADGKRWIAFYTSPDLKIWQFASRIEGFFECPDLFEMPIDDDDDVTRHGCSTRPTANTCSGNSTVARSRPTRASSNCGTATSTPRKPTATRPTTAACRSAGDRGSRSRACRSISR